MKYTSFFEKKGFYIVLALCVTAIGAAGYVSFFSSSDNETLKSEQTTEYVNSPVSKSEIITAPTKENNTSDEKNSNDSSTKETSTKTDTTEEKTPKVEITKPKKVLYIRPVNGDVLKGNSNDEMVKDETLNDWRTHNATDYAVKKDEAVVAIADGVVRSIETSELYGTVITIEHTDGLITKTYGLNSKTTAKVDKNVIAGDVIATALGTFPAEQNLGEHIHIEAYKDEQNIDVENLFA